MRQALNENPVVQVVMIGVLVVVVGFLFMTRIAGQGNPPADEEPTTGEPAASGVVTPTPTAGAPAVPVAGAPTTPAVEAVAPPGAEFVAGPGLPSDVVDAYQAGDTVVLLIVSDGIDDRKVEQAVRSQEGNGSVALFVSKAKAIAEYSRITEGVDVDRVPALVVVHPKRLSDGPLPEATVNYGYRGPQSIAQAVRDANYKGRDDIPSYPE